MNSRKGKPPIQSRIEITRLRSSYFDDEEIRLLCFEMGIDYDDLRPGGRKTKIAELVLLLERHSRLQELLTKIDELRPHAGLNIQELMNEIFSPDDERLREISSLFTQIKDYNEELREWKELHNFLEDTLLSFD